MTNKPTGAKPDRRKIGKKNASKGKSDKNKIRDWYRKQGWMVETVEKYQMIFTPKGRFIVKRDLWGADLIAVRGEECKMIQCKQNKKSEFKMAYKEFSKFPMPSYIKQTVAYWDKDKRCAVEVEYKKLK